MAAGVPGVPMSITITPPSAAGPAAALAPRAGGARPSDTALFAEQERAVRLRNRLEELTILAASEKERLRSGLAGLQPDRTVARPSPKAAGGAGFLRPPALAGVVPVNYPVLDTTPSEGSSGRADPSYRGETHAGSVAREEAPYPWQSKIMEMEEQRYQETQALLRRQQAAAKRIARGEARVPFVPPSEPPESPEETSRQPLGRGGPLPKDVDAFSRLDVNNDGTLDADELDIFKAFDQDGDGLITREEFQRTLRAVLQQVQRKGGARNSNSERRPRFEFDPGLDVHEPASAEATARRRKDAAAKKIQDMVRTHQFRGRFYQFLDAKNAARAAKRLAQYNKKMEEGRKELQRKEEEKLRRKAELERSKNEAARKYEEMRNRKMNEAATKIQSMVRHRWFRNNFYALLDAKNAARSAARKAKYNQKLDSMKMNEYGAAADRRIAAEKEQREKDRKYAEEKLQEMKRKKREAAAITIQNMVRHRFFRNSFYKFLDAKNAQRAAARVAKYNEKLDKLNMKEYGDAAARRLEAEKTQKEKDRADAQKKLAEMQKRKEEAAATKIQRMVRTHIFRKRFYEVLDAKNAKRAAARLAKYNEKLDRLNLKEYGSAAARRIAAEKAEKEKDRADAERKLAEMRKRKEVASAVKIQSMFRHYDFRNRFYAKLNANNAQRAAARLAKYNEKMDKLNMKEYGAAAARRIAEDKAKREKDRADAKMKLAAMQKVKEEAAATKIQRMVRTHIFRNRFYAKLDANNAQRAAARLARYNEKVDKLKLEEYGAAAARRIAAEKAQREKDRADANNKLAEMQKRKKAAAAIKIQAMVRKHLFRKRFYEVLDANNAQRAAARLAKYNEKLDKLELKEYGDAAARKIAADKAQKDKDRENAKKKLVAMQKNKEEAAVIKIQRMVRRHFFRKRFYEQLDANNEQRAAARQAKYEEKLKKLQIKDYGAAAERKALALNVQREKDREHARKKLVELEKKKREVAATKIQTMYRRFRFRKRFHALLDSKNARRAAAREAEFQRKLERLGVQDYGTAGQRHADEVRAQRERERQLAQAKLDRIKDMDRQRAAVKIQNMFRRHRFRRRLYAFMDEKNATRAAQRQAEYERKLAAMGVDKQAIEGIRKLGKRDKEEADLQRRTALKRLEMVEVNRKYTAAVKIQTMFRKFDFRKRFYAVLEAKSERIAAARRARWEKTLQAMHLGEYGTAEDRNAALLRAKRAKERERRALPLLPLDEEPPLEEDRRERKRVPDRRKDVADAANALLPKKERFQANVLRNRTVGSLYEQDPAFAREHASLTIQAIWWQLRNQRLRSRKDRLLELRRDVEKARQRLQEFEVARVKKATSLVQQWWRSQAHADMQNAFDREQAAFPRPASPAPPTFAMPIQGTLSDPYTRLAEQFEKASAEYNDVVHKMRLDGSPPGSPRTPKAGVRPAAVFSPPFGGGKPLFLEGLGKAIEDEAYRRFDTNRDGMISFEEYRLELRQANLDPRSSLDAMVRRILDDELMATMADAQSLMMQTQSGIAAARVSPRLAPLLVAIGPAGATREGFAALVAKLIEEAERRAPPPPFPRAPVSPPLPQDWRGDLALEVEAKELQRLLATMPPGPHRRDVEQKVNELVAEMLQLQRSRYSPQASPARAAAVSFAPFIPAPREASLPEAPAPKAPPPETSASTKTAPAAETIAKALVQAEPLLAVEEIALRAKGGTLGDFRVLPDPDDTFYRVQRARLDSITPPLDVYTVSTDPHEVTPKADVITVNIIKASGLRNVDGWFSGKTDSYCVCSLKGKETMSKFVTEVQVDDLNPRFDHVGVLASFEPGDVVRVEIWDKNAKPKRDELLGAVEIPSSTFYPSGFAGDLKFKDSKGKPCGTISIMVPSHQVAAAAKWSRRMISFRLRTEEEHVVYEFVTGSLVELERLRPSAKDEFVETRSPRCDINALRVSATFLVAPAS